MDIDSKQAPPVPVRRYEYDEETVIVADLGAAGSASSVDVLDDVAIVTIDGPEGPRDFEIEIPDDVVSNTFITNGILTIEVTEE
ncbi:MAG: hypothetical protein ABEJ71_02670 [Halodesulfurarchaeum sp.]